MDEAKMEGFGGVSCKPPRRQLYMQFRAIDNGEEIITGVEIENVLCITEEAIQARLKNCTDKLIGEWRNWIEKNKD